MPLLLAVDTSGKNGSIALARWMDGQQELNVLEVLPLTGGAFSAQLVPQIAAILEKHGYTRLDIGALAVASGPGSFTGLRVGLAAIKALSEALQKPIAAVSLLEALAFAGNAHGNVLAVLDAGRGDVYAGDYEVESLVSATPAMRSERLLSREEFLDKINDTNLESTAIVTSDAMLAESLRASGIIPEGRLQLIAPPDSAVIAQLAWRHLRQGRTVLPENLEPNYIRRSDAEIFSKQ